MLNPDLVQGSKDVTYRGVMPPLVPVDRERLTSSMGRATTVEKLNTESCRVMLGERFNKCSEVWEWSQR